MKVPMIVFFYFFVIVATAFCKGAPEDRIKDSDRVTLTITNNTKGVIKEIVFNPSKGEPYTQTHNIEKGKSVIIYDVRRSESYDIFLVDTKKHRYGKTGCRWMETHGTLIITDEDYVSEGWWRDFLKAIGK